MPVTSAFEQALRAAKTMPGWTIVAADAHAGRIEASQQSRWFRFTDDIVIRIAGIEAGSRMTMRSTSRQGRATTASMPRGSAPTWRRCAKG